MIIDCKKFFSAGLILAAAVAPAMAADPVQLIPAGNTSLPAGNYLIHNLGTGEALYMQVSGGQMLVQDAKKVQWSPQTGLVNAATGAATGAATTVPAAASPLTGAGSGNALLNKLESSGLLQKLGGGSLGSQLNSLTGGTSGAAGATGAAGAAGTNAMTGNDTQDIKTKIQKELLRQGKKIENRLKNSVH